MTEWRDRGCTRIYDETGWSLCTCRAERRSSVGVKQNTARRILGSPEDKDHIPVRTCVERQIGPALALFSFYIRIRADPLSRPTVKQQLASFENVLQNAVELLSCWFVEPPGGGVGMSATRLIMSGGTASCLEVTNY